jgi:TolB protein
MFRLNRLVPVLAALLVALPVLARAEIRIDITQGVVEPVPIAITDFAGDASVGAEIAQIVTSDLSKTGLFAPIDPRAFIQDSASINPVPRFADWRVLATQALVAGTVSLEGDGRYRIDFRLWDVIAEQQLFGYSYFASGAQVRRVAHTISDQIYRTITGEEGFFDTQIVYVSETGPQTNRVKRLAIMDQDGANHQYLTDGSQLVLTPRYSPTTRQITYFAYVNNRPRVYLMDLGSGRQEILGDFAGMTFAPRFSPDGNRVVFSLATDGNSDIYVMDLRTRGSQRLTSDPSIDTSPSYSPDGSQIVFESDRGGSQQLYIMGADGSGVRRLSYGEGRYASPVWSPRGDLIAFTHIGGGQFSIGVIRPDGTGERTLASGFLAESPTWAPNGRYLAYAAGGGGSSKLLAVDITGQHSWQIPTPLDGSDPAWSPLLP